MKILILLAKGFETMEFSPFVDIFGWARHDFGHDIHVVTCGFQKQVVSTFNVTVMVDKLIDQINTNCPETAPHVAFKVLEILTSKQEMEMVKVAMGY